jgi:hypothetical protein
LFAAIEAFRPVFVALLHDSSSDYLQELSEDRTETLIHDVIELLLINGVAVHTSELGLARLPENQLSFLVASSNDDVRRVVQSIAGRPAERERATRCIDKPLDRCDPDDENIEHVHLRHTRQMLVADGISGGNGPNRVVPAFGPGITLHAGLPAGFSDEVGTSNSAKTDPGLAEG